MLGKTAGGVYWLYRYLERVENAARLVETGQRIALTRARASDDEWDSVLKTAGVDHGYHAKYSELAKDKAIDWMLRDQDNSSSVLSVVRTARDNARLVRTALTHEIWEAVNSSWMQLNRALSRKIDERDLPAVLALIRNSAALVRGTTAGTKLRNDVYNFGRLGTYIERADNTARIIDVKYYVLLPSSLSVGSTLDNAQWDTILRSVSAGGGFRLIYGRETRPRQIVQFLVLDRRMPRSLNFCAAKIRHNLDYLAQNYDNQMPAHELAGSLAGKLDNQDVDAVFGQGLHEYLQDILSALASLSRQIEIDYRFYE